MLTDKDLLKFRQPLEINYIKTKILKLNEEQTNLVLIEYLNAGILKKEGKYYSLK